ncbi:MAG: helix-turn-helix domain-containing protein [Clostridia bacterium]|nr:helix-turn-helix domain-containing protein [Clostridia bacterium]
MRNTSKESTALQYPQKEKAYACVATSNAPFHSAVVGITYPNPDYRITRGEKHKLNVMEYVLEGSGEICLGGVWKKVKAGDTYILREEEAHVYRADPNDPWKKLWINYRADYIAAFMDAYGICSDVYPATDTRKYFDLAMEAVRMEVSGIELCRTVADCVHKIISFAASKRAHGTDSDDSDEYRIREELNAALYRKLDLDELSVKLHISKSNIIRIFKKRYGVTPYEYLLASKIDAAKALLQSSQMTVKEIADRLCISDEHYFSTLFCNRVGVRPSDFRKSGGKTEKN